MNWKIATGIILLVLVSTAIAILFNPFSENIGIPEKPDDFAIVKRDIYRGMFYNLETLTPDYYLQPELYINPDRKQEIREHDYGRWGVHGYGAFPAEISYKAPELDAGQFVTTYTFVKAGDELETFQGLKLEIQNPDSNIFETEVIPENILFAPTFPERIRYKSGNETYDWAYKVQIKIGAKKQIPEGQYTFKLTTSTPDNQHQEKFYQAVQNIKQRFYNCNFWEKCDNNIVELRKKVYVDGGIFQAEKFFTFVLQVGN